MTTVTGAITTAGDVPLKLLLLFVPVSDVFPYVMANGRIVTVKPVAVTSNAQDGTWSVQLEGGTYRVCQSNVGDPDALVCVVPADNGTYSLDQLTSRTQANQLPAAGPSAPAGGVGSPLGKYEGTGGYVERDPNNNPVAFWWNDLGGLNDWNRLLLSPP